MKDYEIAIAWEAKYNEEVERAKRVEKLNNKKIAKYQEDIESLNSNINELHVDIESLTQNVFFQSYHYLLIIYQFNGATEEGLAVKEDLTIMQSNFELLKNENSALRGEIENLHSIMEDYEQQLFDANTENEALKNTQAAENELLKEAYSTMEYMQMKLAEMQKDFAALMKSLNETNKVTSIIKLENVKLTEKQLEKERQFEELFKNLNEYETKMNKLNSDINVT